MLPMTFAATLYSESFSIDAQQDQITVPLRVRDANDLYGFELDVVFADSITYNNHSLGAFLQGEEFLDGRDLGIFEIQDTRINNLLYTSKGNISGASGSGVLTYIQFNVSAYGQSEFYLENVELSDSDGNAIPTQRLAKILLFMPPWRTILLMQ